MVAKPLYFYFTAAKQEAWVALVGVMGWMFTDSSGMDG